MREERYKYDKASGVYVFNGMAHTTRSTHYKDKENLNAEAYSECKEGEQPQAKG